VDASSAAPTGLDSAGVARSTRFALLATAIEKGGAMALLLVVARLLGAEGFGRYAAVMSLVALAQVAAECGQEPVLVRLLAPLGERIPAALVQGALAMRVAFAAAAAALLLAIGAAAFPTLGRAPLLVAGLGLVAGSGMALRAVFRTWHRLEWLCVTAAANIATFALALVTARALGLGTAGAVAAWAAGQLGASVAALALARRRIAIVPRWRTDVTTRIAGSGWALALNAFLLTATLRIGQLIVLRVDGPTAVGYLTAGSRLAEAFALLPESLMLMLLPVLSAYDATARDAQRRVSVRAVRSLGLLALPVVIALSIAAPWLLGLLYGAGYAAGAPALRVLAWLAVLAASGTVFTNLLIARGHERLLLALNAFASVLTLGLSVLAVPRLGFVGAALATLAASVVSQIVLLVLPATRADVAACLRPLAVPTAVAVLLTFAGMYVGGPPPLVAGGAALVFAAVVVATRHVDADDWKLLRRVLAGA
jgi:O-antigen/teichoic acid export membrane protein